MTFEQSWLENDYNPYILFDSNGKILSLNTQAQLILGANPHKEIYDLALSYASSSFGFKTTSINFSINRYVFFAITVGYEDEFKIGIKLYKTQDKTLIKPSIRDGELVNIYTIIDLFISSVSIGKNIVFEKGFDPTIPDIIINSNQILKVLNKIFLYLDDTKPIDIKVFYKIGEHIKFNEKKYSLFTIEFQLKNAKDESIKEIDNFKIDSSLFIEIKDKIVDINIPIINMEN